MTLVPATLVLIVGSELIRTNIDRWFNAPMGDILSSANQIASDYYQQRQAVLTDHAAASPARSATTDLTRERRPPDSRSAGAGSDAAASCQMLEVYRVGTPNGSLPTLEPVVDVAAPQMPPGYSRAPADRLAGQALGGGAETRSIETLGASGDLLHAAAVIRSNDGRATGVVVATDYLTGELAMRSRRMTRGVRELQPAARPATAADRFVPVVLSHGHAADSLQRDLDGLVSGQADHAAGADAVGRRPRDRRRAAWISASSRRATTSSAR